MGARATTPPQRITLIDFDWEDVDVIPELLRLADVRVCRVAGRSERDPGVRVADLCGVPHTLDLDALSRDEFAVALVGSHSPRRARIRDWLRGTGAELRDAREFLAGLQRAPEPPRVDRPELTQLAPEALATLVDSAIPDLEPGPAGAWSDAPARPSAAWTDDTATAAPRFVTGAAGDSVEAFRARIDEVVERHELNGQTFVVHRLHLDTAPCLVDALCRDLVRDAQPGDALCRVGRDVLVLSCGPSSAYARVMDRLRAVVELGAAQAPDHPPSWGCERIELASRDDADLFRFVTGGWLRES